MQREKSLLTALQVAGGYAALARKLGKPYTKQQIWNWRRVPVQHWWAVSRVTGIPMEKFYPQPKKRSRAS